MGPGVDGGDVYRKCGERSRRCKCGGGTRVTYGTCHRGPAGPGQGKRCCVDRGRSHHRAKTGGHDGIEEHSGGAIRGGCDDHRGERWTRRLFSTASGRKSDQDERRQGYFPNLEFMHQLLLFNRRQGVLSFDSMRRFRPRPRRVACVNLSCDLQESCDVVRTRCRGGEVEKLAECQASALLSFSRGSSG